MEKEFVPHDLALELKELGFNESCLATYHKELHTIIPIYAKYTTEDVIKAPLYQQVFRWFREKHELKIFFAYWNGYDNHGFISEYKYECYIIPPNGPSITVRGENDKVYFDIYEEAELACLKKLIEIIKSKQ